MASETNVIEQIQELLKIKEDEIESATGTTPDYETWEKVMKLVAEADPPNSSLTPEYMWKRIWKELDKRGRYSRKAVPKGHDPTVIYNSIKIITLFAVFENTHPVDALFMGYFMRNFGQLDQAQNAYQIAADKGNVDALIGLGTIAEAKGDVSTAEQYYRDALSKGVMRSCANIGNIYRRQGNFSKALEMYTTGVAHNETDCIYMAAKIHNDPDIKEFYNLDTAEKLFDQAIGLGCHLSMYERGKTLLENDMIEQGLALLEQSAELGFTVAMELLIWYYGLTKDLENCVKWTDRLVDAGDAIAKEFLTTVLDSRKENGEVVDQDIQNMVDSFPATHLGYTFIPKESSESVESPEPSDGSDK